MKPSLTHTRRIIAAIFISGIVVAAVALGPDIKARVDSNLASLASSTAGVPFAPTLTASKSDTSLSGDGDGKADPGETIGYTVLLGNTGPDPATGVSFSDTIDPNTTLVAGSLAVSAVAANDTFPVTVVGNVAVNSAALASPFSVISNDFLGVNPAATIVTAAGSSTISSGTITGTSAQGGTVVINVTTGFFTYNPAPGFEGADSFTYILADNPAAPSAAGNRTATVSITVAGMIWFINNNAAACTTIAAGCGRLSSPFSDMASFVAVNGAIGPNNPGDNDNIFVYESSTAYTGLTLRPGQRLFGQDATASLSSITGLTPPVGSLAFPAMNTGAPATTISGTAGVGVALNNTGSSNTLRGFSVGNSTPGISGNSFGTLTLSEVAVNSNSGAIVLNTGTANATFTSVTSTGGNVNVNLTNIAGNVNLGTGALSGAVSYGVLMNQGTASASYAGTITAGNGTRPVEITNKTGGTVAFSGLISTAPAATSNGPFMSANAGTTINFTGGVQVSTGSNPAFTAIGGGTVNVTQNNTSIFNTLTTTSATALNIANTTIGASGVTFRSISSGTGSDNGIILNTTGTTGGLSVVGTGGAGSGGTIANKNGADGSATQGTGIYLNSTSNVSLSSMQLNNFQNFGIRGLNVNNFDLINTTVNHSSGKNGTDAATDEGSIYFGVENPGGTNGLTGVVNITNCLIEDGFENNFKIANLSGNLSQLTMTGTTIRDNSAVSPGNNGFEIRAQGTANITADITTSTFTGNRANGIQVTTSTEHTGTVDVEIGTAGVAGSGGTFTNNNIGVNIGHGSAGTLNFDVHRGTYNSSPGLASPININLAAGGGGPMNGFVTNNTITNANSPTGPGIRVTTNGTDADGSNVLTIQVSNNNISQIGNRGIEMIARDGNSDINATVTNNTVQLTDALSADGIRIDAGATSTDTNSICASITGNDADTAGVGSSGIRIRQRFASTTYRLPGYAGSPVVMADVQSFLQANNLASSGFSADFGGGGFSGGAACATPPIAPPADEIGSASTDDVQARTTERHYALVADMEKLGFVAADGAKLGNGNVTDADASILRSISNAASRLVSFVIPTVGAQTTSLEKISRGDAPMSGETISVGPINTLPSGKTVVITFSVTVDALDSGEIRTRILNQGTADSVETSALATSDLTPNADPACAGTTPATCTPVDRPDTTVTSVNRVTSSPTNAASVQWTITFADAVAGLTAANLTLTDTTTSCSGESLGAIAPVGGGPGATQWTVNANTGTGSCTLRLDIANTNGLSHDVTNVPFTSGETIVVDKLAPSTTSFTRFDPATSPTNADTLVFRATFSEDVVNVDAADFSVSGTTATVTLVTPVSGSIYDITVSGGDLAGLNGTVGLNFSGVQNITDTATNPLPGTEPAIDQTYLVDNTAPTVNIVDVSPDPRNTAVASIAINFSEDVTGFDIGDLTLTRDGSGNLLPGGTSITGGPANYTLSSTTAVTTTDGAYVLTLSAAGAGITDVAGNALAIGDSDDWIKDAIAPTVTINQAAGQSDPTFTNPINFTAVFNEPVTDFDDAADVVVTGTAPGVGTATVVITPNSSTNYTVAISGITGDGTIIANIPANVAVDLAGNPNVISTSTDNLVTFITCVPPPANMVAWYTGDGTATDIAGGFDGTLENGAAYSAGKVEQGFSFDGADDHVAIGDVDLPSTFTIDAWVNPTSLGAERTIVNKDAGLRSFFFNITSTGALRAVVQSGAAGGVFTQYQTAGGVVTVGSFQHIAVTYDGGAAANQKFRFYVNGSLVASTVQFSQDNGGTPLNTANPARVGLAFDGTAPFVGVIDELELFSRVLSIAEIQNLFTADGGGKCKPSDLSLTKSDGNLDVVPGGTVSYTLSYTNTGKTATGVVLGETVPANTTFDPGASTAGWVCAPDNNAGSTCTFNVGSLASLASGSVVFAVTSADPVAAGLAQISNTATIADDGANGTELHVADNTATDTTPLNAQPDLTVTKTDGGATVSPGGTVTYTLNYANDGNQGATGVVLTETVPANTTFNAGASTAGWACTPNNNAGSTCTLAVGSLAGGGASGSATFAVTVVNPVAAGVAQISNTASIADDGTNGVDPTPGNNTGADTTPVNAAPDLTVTKSDGGTTTIPGGTVAYTLSYSNIGNQGATGVVLTETVPLHTTFNPGASTSGWTCVPNNNAGSTCSLAVGGINGGGAPGSATFAVTTNTTGLLGVSQIDNTASIADDGANGADTNPGNNTGNDSTPRVCQTINVTNPALTSSLIGLPFSQNFTESGGFGGATFTTVSPLPNGLTLSPAGLLSGTPTETGLFPIVVTVTDGNGCTGTSTTYNLNITCNINPVVTNNSDNAVDSLRYAVATACSGPGQNTVTFQPGPAPVEGDASPNAADITSPISLSSGQIAITRNVNIVGPGASLLTVQNTAAAGSTSRVFRVNAGVTASISGLTISGGNILGSFGGGIFNFGNLSLDGVTIANNTADFGGGGIRTEGGSSITITNSTIRNNASQEGGGLDSSGTLTINIANSTIHSNTASSGSGGLANTGTLIVNNSTISGNSAPFGGGVGNFGTATFNGSTISNNSGPSFGGGLRNVGTTDLNNSIVANSAAGADCAVQSGTVNAAYSLIEDGLACVNGTNSNNLTGDPGLAPLANNGGPTATHALCTSAGVPDVSCTGVSPAIDKGFDFVGNGFDQRGNGPNFERPFDIASIANATGGDGSDIGAYELNNTPPTIVPAVGVTRQAGSAVSNSTIATVGDLETPVGSLTVSVNGGATATDNGITVSNLVNTNGTITADIVAACVSGTESFILEVTDGGGLTANAILTVTVLPNTAPVLTYNNPAAVVFGQSGITVNPATGPTDNGLVASVSVQSTGTFTGGVSVNASGAVSISNSAPVGTHTITIRAVDNCGAVTDATFTLVVNRASTTTTITSDEPDPSVFGQNYTVTVAVGPVAPGAGVPTGNISVTDGTNSCLITLPATSCQLPGTTVGGLTLTASYAGDGNFSGSSDTEAHTVNKANTTTVVQTLQNAPVYGETFTITGSVAANPPGSGVPQGTISFLDGASPIAGCQALPLNALGSATCSLNNLPAGVRTINGQYSGNANFNASNGSSTQTVNPAILNVTASSHNLTYGDAVPVITNTITGFVLGQTAAVITTQPTCNTTYTQGSGAAASPYPTNCSGAAAPNYVFNYIPGSINVAKKALNVTADNKARGYGAANPPLTATITGFVLGQNLGTSDVTGTPGLSTTATATSPAGAYPITVTLGNLQSNNYSFGTFTNGTLTVNSIQLTVTAENKTRVFGAANPPLTFTVTGFANGEGLGNLTGSPNLSTTAIATSAPGAYPITITQGTLANANYTFAFVNGTLTVTGGAATTTTITNAAALAANATAVGQSYAVNWSVQPVPPAAGTLTGNVTVTDGTGATCTAAVAAGTCSLTSTTVGTKTITATYAGDTNFAGSTSIGVLHNVVLVISGNVKQFVPFGTNTNLEGVTITLTNTTTDQSAATTTDAGGNYSFGVVVSGNNFVVTPSGLGRTYEPISRTYTNVTTNITNADFVAYNAPGPGGNPREVRVVNTVANAGSPVAVPIDVTSQANETRFEFSLSFDNALLGIPTVACGTNTTGCTVTVNTSIPGRAGITISNFPALTAGAREIARVTFPTSLNTATSTAISFTDQPTVRDVRNANNDPLPALYRTGFVSFNSDLEGDVAGPNGMPPGGDGVLANDVTILRLMVLGLMTPTAGQYRNADAAPRSTLGDGCPINATDVTQVGRYNLGLDPPTPAGGPAALNPGTCTPPTFADEGGDQAAASSRAIRILSANAQPGSRVSLQVELDAIGNEAAASFTVNFNASMMRYVSAQLSAGVPDGTSLAMNTTQTGTGKLGVLFDSTGSFAEGTRSVMTVTFDILPNAAGTLPVTFSDDLAARSVSSSNANAIASNFAGGSVNLTNSTERTIRGRVTTPSGQGLRNASVTLIGPDGTRRTAVTSSFGLYEFTLVPEGTNTVTVTSRRYRFAPRTITPTDTITTVDFVGLE